MNKLALTAEAKKALKGMVLSLRELLEGEFDSDTYEPVLPGGDVVRQLARLGIDAKRPRSLDSEAAPEYLTADERQIRERICAAIRRQASLFGDPSHSLPLKRGFRAYVRETTYTWINRLLGLKCMEIRGLLRDEHGEPDFVVTASDQFGGLPRRAWRIKGQNPAKWQKASVHELLCAAIEDACTQLTLDIRVLFDPESPHTLIWPSPQALTTLLQKIQELDAHTNTNDSPFASHDFLGWVYQYFQTKEKDQVFEAASKKKRKIEKDDIIPATQIYTEEYMVAYLVQNTLGRFWMEMHPDSSLAQTWEYYVKPPEGNPPVSRDLKKASQLKLMDPALGGGHFHLAGFDLLFEMYVEELANAGKPGWPEKPSVRSRADIPLAIIESNLYGIDIDARAVQIATLALYMKAREAGYQGPIQSFHFVVANAAPFDSPSWHEFIKAVNDKGSKSAARVLAALGKQLKNLDEYGSLLRVEEEIQKVIGEETHQWVYQKWGGSDPGVLFAEMARPRQQRLSFEKEITDATYFADTLSPAVERELDQFYRSARQKGLAETAILASDADRGFDFLRLCMERYDVVYTNPPYMGSKNMGEQLKDFVARAYPEGKRDLYAAFILRCLELAEPNGYVGMVTQQSWMFLRSFADLRAMPEEKVAKAGSAFKGLLRETTIESIAHLGPHAFSEIGGEVVNIALFALRKALPAVEHRMTAFRLIGPKSPELKEKGLSQKNQEKTFVTPQISLVTLKESPMAYWLSDRMIQLLQEHGKPTKNDHVIVSQGLTTGDVGHFVRFFWECCYDQEHWWWYTAGGGYKKWAGNEYLLVDWEENGSRIRKHVTENYPPEKFSLLIKQPETFGRTAVYYGAVARGSLGPRLCERAIFGDSAPGVLHTKMSRRILAGILSTRLASFLLRALSATVLTIRDPYLVRLPLYNAPLSDNVTEMIDLLVSHCFKIKCQLVSGDLTERQFDPTIVCRMDDPLHELSLSAKMHSFESIIETVVLRDLGFGNDEASNIMSETGMPPGWYPIIKGYQDLREFDEYKFDGLSVFLDEAGIQFLEEPEILHIKSRLKIFYESGYRSTDGNQTYSIAQDDAEDDQIGLGAYIPIPPETFLEELSQKLELHPISVYWLIKEMRDKEGLRCPPEEKRHAEDYVSVMIIRMLGYQWPKQVEAGEPLPEWVDDDGIIPLGEGLGEPSLLDRVRERFGADFGVEKEASIEAEFGNMVGKPLGRWLEEEFFERHVKQFKSRPIAWHIVSDPSVVEAVAGSGGKGKRKGAKKKRSPAFSVLVHYHRFVDGEKGYRMLQLLRNKYLQKVISRTRMELEGLRGRGADPEVFDRIAELDRRMIELEDFREKLERIQEGKDRESRIHVRWKSREEQPKGWRPDINDGVKINIAPWERLGLFPVKKIVGKVEMGE